MRDLGEDPHEPRHPDDGCPWPRGASASAPGFGAPAEGTQAAMADDAAAGGGSIPVAARAQAVLEGVGLPATRDELVRYARAAGAEPELVQAIALRAPARVGRLDDVGEAIAATKPSPPAPPPAPRPWSGAPPGGDAYTDPSAEPGAVRPASGDGPAS